MARVLLAAFIAASTLPAQTSVPVLLPHTSLHNHYLFNRSFSFDGQDYTGLPWRFYYANVGSSPAPTTLRTRCPLQQVNGTPYDHANFGWFRYPVPGGNGTWPRANGTEPLAATGEYLETAQFRPVDNTNPAGFVFTGEFAGVAKPASTPTTGPGHFFVEAVYFTDRECSDGGTEYGWYRKVADSSFGDTPVNSFVFYYSKFTNCNLDYGCWDTNGHQVKSTLATATMTDVAPNAAGTYEYKFQVIRSGPDFNISVLDPGTDQPVTCQWSISTGGGASGPCEFPVAIESGYPTADQMNSGYIVIATQSSHLFPATTGQPYPQWYDYGVGGSGASPPMNVAPTTEPNGTKSCITGGAGYACLDAVSLQVLYE
jgi:hypothetical protein